MYTTYIGTLSSSLTMYNTPQYAVKISTMWLFLCFRKVLIKILVSEHKYTRKYATTPMHGIHAYWNFCDEISICNRVLHTKLDHPQDYA